MIQIQLVCSECGPSNLVVLVHSKEYYLTTKDSITIPFIIQKLVDHPFELLKENKSLGPQEKKVYSI